MLHEHVWKAPLPTDSLIFDSCTYDLGWEGLQTGDHSSRSAPILPTKDHATHLVGVVKFHCGQLFHLWDDSIFTEHLDDFYAQDPPSMKGREIWYVQFLLILAFGKAFSLKRSQGNRPPGADFFVAALRALPHHMYLFSDPSLSAEVLCCIALYFQCIDYRMLAHNYVSCSMNMPSFYADIDCHVDRPSSSSKLRKRHAHRHAISGVRAGHRRKITANSLDCLHYRPRDDESDWIAAMLVRERRLSSLAGVFGEQTTTDDSRNSDPSLESDRQDQSELV